jgi:hypothetical protein
MVEIADIKDKDSLQAWLKDQHGQVSVWIAARAAARALPIWWQAVVPRDWGRKRDVFMLPILRGLLISKVASFVPTDDIRFAAHAARDAANAAFTAHGAHAATYAAAAHPAAAYPAAASAAAAAYAVTSSYAAAAAAFWAAIRTDAEQAAQSQISDALPLWPDGQNPLDKEWSDIKAQVAASPDAPDWQFWLDWYDAQLAGNTLLPDPARTWEMLEKIALIDPATWDAGPEMVNPRIRDIRELYRLRAEVAALQSEKEEFLAARASQARRSHNQPPDGLVDDQPEVARQITIVWGSLDEARDELAQDTPDKGRLRDIAERLLSALTAIGKYIGKVADTAIMSAAEGAGKTAGKLAVHAVGVTVLDRLLNNGRLLQFAKDLLGYASGG